MTKNDLARGGGGADHRRVQTPTLKDRLGIGFAPRFEDGQHPLLAFREHHFIGGHALFALGDEVQVKIYADAALAGHFNAGGRQASRAHVLDRGHRTGGHELQRRLDQQLLGEGVAHLDRRPLGLGIGVELCRGHGRAMDPVPPGLGTEIDHRKIWSRRG